MLGNVFSPSPLLPRRYITLRNEGNQPINMASLFVFLKVREYVPKGLEGDYVVLPFN